MITLNVISEKLNDIHRQLAELEKDNITIVERCCSSLRLLQHFNQECKDVVRKNTFGSDVDEIQYFKVLRPELLAGIIFYGRIHQVETSLPNDSVKNLRKLYKPEMKRIEEFYANNRQFIEYIRSGQTYMDNTYFLRAAKIREVSLLNYNYDTDYEQSTNFDLIVAEYLACERISKFIRKRIRKGETTSPVVPQFGLQWTESKIALVELIYALHSSGAINNGGKDIKELATFFEQTFNIDLGDYYKSYLDIKMRKAGPAKFIESLAENLQRRIDSQDQF